MPCNCGKSKKGIPNMLSDINFMAWSRDIWRNKIGDTSLEDLNDEQKEFVLKLYKDIWIHSKETSLENAYNQIKSVI